MRIVWQWSDNQKNVQLLVLTLASITSELYFGLGVAGVSDIAHTYGVSRDRVTSLTGSCVNNHPPPSLPTLT